MKREFLFTLLVLLFLALGTTLVALYGKGYQFGLTNGKPELSGTGLLVATSNPDGASVYINGHLTTATDNTINLFPGEYTVRITKDGYFPWEKKLKVQKEVVSKAQALLFPTAPKLESITSTGIENPTLDPSQTRVAYTAGAVTPRKNGIFVLDMTTRPIITLQSSSIQLVDDTADFFSTANLSWSPDGRQLLASVSSQLTVNTYLLDADDFNENPADISATLLTLQNSWDELIRQKELSRLNSHKPKLRTLITKHFNVLAWSPDESKILYQASLSAQLPLVILPRLIGADLTPEDRSLKQGEVYVYDIKEDKNYQLQNVPKIASDTSSIRWFPDSSHLIYVEDKKITIVEYDGGNPTTIYAGPFIDNYVFPWPNASKVVILTNLNNPNIPANLYTISLK